MPSAKKRNVVFVGSFKQKEGSSAIGGQLFACSSLVNSKLKEKYNFLLVDTTTSTNLKRPFYVRAIAAVRRCLKSFYYLLFKDAFAIIIFVGYGFSFVEKGVIAVGGSLLGKNVILAPRSGFIKGDVERNGKLSKFISYVIRRVNAVVCQGQIWADFYGQLDKDHPNKFVVVKNWLSKISPLSPKQDGVMHILFLAWVDRQKGIFELIEAIKNLEPEVRRRIKVDVAGDGKAMDETVNLLAVNGLEDIVEMHGWVQGKSKEELLKRAHIYVLPSYAEGMPNALLEALSYQCACIGSRVGSIPNVIAHERTGLLIDPKNSEQLQEALTKLICNTELRTKIAIQGYQYVKAEHTIEQAVEIFDTILDSSLVDNNRLKTEMT